MSGHDWRKQTYGSAPQLEVPGLFQMYQPGSQNGSLSIEDQLGMAQLADYQSLPAYRASQLEIARQAAAPQSKWLTGAQTFGSVAQGLAGLGGIYLGYQNMKQQKKAFEFNKGVVNTNLNNSIMDYNRRLNDTLSNRALNNGQGAGWVSSELAKFSAKRS